MIWQVKCGFGLLTSWKLLMLACVDIASVVVVVVIVGICCLAVDSLLQWRHTQYFVNVAKPFDWEQASFV